MSVSMWSYRPEICDGGGCPGDCDLCDKPKNMEDEDDTTDYIKREDAIKAFENICIPRKATNGIVVLDIDEALSEIELVPSADVRENIKGRWIDYRENRWIYARCSECGTVHDTKTNFCPYCGADMRGE